MKSLITALGAVSLLGGCVQVAASQSTTTRHVPTRVEETALEYVPVESQVPMKHDMDACHKRDTRPREGPNYPCVMQAWIEILCRANGTTQQHLQAEQQCICGKGSSFFKDAVACSQCKTSYGLQGTAEHPHWKAFYQEKLQPLYCQASVLEGNFTYYYDKIDPKANYPPRLGMPGNTVDNVYGPIGVVAVKEYYPDAPERQGPGEFTPVPASGDVRVRRDTATVLVDGMMAVPAVVVIKPNGTNGTSTPLTSTTAQPTTLTRVVAKNTTAQALPTNTSPAAVNDQHSLVVNGHAEAFTLYTEQKCAIIFNGSVDKFELACKTLEIFRASIRRLVTKEQWDMAKKLPDASTVKDCEAALQDNGITGELVSKDVEAPGNDEKLPDSDKVPISDDKVPTSGGQSGAPGSETESDDDDECIDEDAAIPGNKPPTQSGGNTSSGEAGKSGNASNGQSGENTSGEAGNASNGQSGKISSGESGKSGNTSGESGESGNASNGHSGNASNGQSSKPGNASNGESGKSGNASNGQSGKTSSGEAGQSGNASNGQSSKPGNASNGQSGKTSSGEAGQSGNDSSKNTPAGQNQSDACAEQARIQQACDNNRDCMCKEPFFLAAINCARRKDLTCDAQEYWTQFYLELQYRFCEKKEHGQKFDKAYADQSAVWDEARNPYRRKQFN